MLARIHSAATLGLEARVLDVEVDASTRPAPLHDRRASRRERPRGARARPLGPARTAAFAVPDGAVTVNLAPADFRKCGAALDLPVALGLLWLGGVRPPDTRQPRSSSGSSGLGGEVRPVRGALCLALAARDAGFEEIVAARRQRGGGRGRRRASASFPVAHLSDAVAHVLGDAADRRPRPRLRPRPPSGRAGLLGDPRPGRSRAARPRSARPAATTCS